MKAGLTTSVVLHAALLGFGLVSLSAPTAFDVADVEALPIDIIPIESITQIQEGDKKATMAEKPAPKPTEKPKVVVDAQKVGDNTVDADTPPTPDPSPKPVKAAGAPEPTPEPTPLPDPRPDTAPAKTKETASVVPATEVKAEPTPRQEVKPDPVPTPVVAEKPDAETVALPDSAPAPNARPQPPLAQTAKAPDRKDAEKPVKKAAEKPKSEEKSLEDEVAALLNKEKASGGGARHSSEVASLGGEKKTTGTRLTQSEMDALRGQIQRCWNVPAGAMDVENLRISVQFKLDQSGALDGEPRVVKGGGSSGVALVATEAALRAVRRCGPYNLPADKYEAWADVIVNFDPRDMF
ncbi:MAG: cell envelope integrity protein TolA [Rhizobiaceae bacterium]|nr:cell envelope integrity protein TolA [Rhizobiaceae bacterium]